MKTAFGHLADLETEQPYSDSSLSFTPELLAELLDPAAWAPVLETYARTTKVAVALADAKGLLIGGYHNLQHAWLLVHGSEPDGTANARSVWLLRSLAKLPPRQ